MVCTKCEKKLSKVAAPDPFKSSSASIKEGSRNVGGSKLIGKPKAPSTSSTSKTTRFQPYAGKCKDCKQTVTQNRAKYCHGCAFKKGICSICGKQILDTSGYSMSAK
ncbi:hypothetical protein FA95DRAFT_1558403 [Auriscalpium vulgare]|uniref:Uncharacterized protein n=1 Tax=Auriscalpium vulgare TaxID=40419 RepID=A0ACB8RWE4_9AGAM|nr:hypothetical protein FA95DRAFT_1558403 [Auriscalpium vulgare]